MNYGQIYKTDIANGNGVRVSLFVSGCNHFCHNCFNQEAWDREYGREFTQETIDEILQALEPDYITGLSLLGGEPMEPYNQEEVLNLIFQVRQKFGTSKDIWMWTGCTIEELLLGPFDKRYVTDFTKSILQEVDILVEGRFVEVLKDFRLKFRGSSNQRVLDMKQTLIKGEPVLYIQ